MINKYLPLTFILLVFSISCATQKSASTTAVDKKPEPPTYIMGEGKVIPEHLTRFLLRSNPDLSTTYVLMLSYIYVEEAAYEGVNHDIAFTQMCLETGFLKFGNLVTPDMNNFCGLGSTGLPGPDGQPEKGLSFPDPRTGVRAHIQHLKAYGSTEPLKHELVNPRFRFIQRGRSPTYHGLAGTWAADPNYAVKISNILNQLYEFSFK